MGNGAWKWWVGLAGWLLLAMRVGADTNLDVQVGWGERARQGGWTPITVQVSDPKPRNAVVEVYAPHDSTMAMKISQPVGIGPSAQTYVLYAPLLNMWGEATMVRVRDAATNKVLAEQAILDRGGENVDTKYAQLFDNNGNRTFIGLSGRAKSLGELEHPSSGPLLGYVTEPYLPRVAKGYTGLDFLVLNQPDLATMEIAQQSAICDWVRGGGKVVLWLSEDAVPAGSPLGHLLPCKVGEVILVQATPQELQNFTLPPRFGKIKGRALTPNEGATVIRLLGKEGVAITQRRGMGTVTAISFDASGLQFNDSGWAERFWGRVFDPRNNTENSSSNGWVFAQNMQSNPGQVQTEGRSEAARQVIDVLGDVPGVGTFGFKYVAGVLLAMMVIVGPIDWFLLKKMGKQPWTWVTTLGWIGLITTGAMFIGSLFRSGDLHLRTLRVIEQVDEAVVAKMDVAGIYSPRTTEYRLATAPGSWWEPISTDQYSYSSRGMMQSIPFRQDGRDNRPEEMTINVWNLRFLSGETLEKGAAVLGADLTWSIGVSAGATPTPQLWIKGTVTNLGDAPLTGLWLRTSYGLYDLMKQNGVSGGALEPKGTVQVNLGLAPNDEWNKAKGDVAQGRNGREPRVISRTGVALVKAAGELATVRNARVEEMLEQVRGATPGNFGQREPGARVAVYAVSEAAQPAATLTNEKPIEKHLQVIRAVISMKESSKGATTQK